MTKTEFMNQLKVRLAKLPDYEISRITSFYVESIDDRIDEGMSEEGAIASLGGLDAIVGEILIDTPLTTLIQDKIKQSHKKANNKTIWMTLAICGSPVWFPLMIAIILVIICVFISIWLVVISLFLGLLSLMISTIMGLLLGIFLLFQQDIATSVAAFGISIASTGLLIMSIKPLLWLSKQFRALTVVFLQKIKTLFVFEKGGVV